MNTYQFETTCTMKEYNHKKWWIDSKLIRNIVIHAENMQAALKEYQTIVNDNYGVSISNNALRNKSPMYIDLKTGETKQIGYVITGKTDFNDDYRRWVSQYIDLWVSVNILHEADFN